MSDHWYETPKKMGKPAIQPGQIVAVLAAVSLAMSVWLPMLDANGRPQARSVSLQDGAGRLVAYVLISAGIVLVGAFATPHGTRGVALAAGAAAPIAGLFTFAASLAYVMKAKQVLIGKLTIGPAFYFICVSVVLCLAFVVMTYVQRDRTAEFRGGLHVTVGMISAIGTTIGAMLSPGKAGTSFVKLNFEWSVWHMQIAWIVFVCLVGLPGLVGFAMRTVWGADLALGALLVPVWLVVTALVPLSTPSIFGFVFRTVHPVVVIALAGQIVAQILFRVSWSRRN